MALRVAFEIFRLDLPDVSLVDIAFRDLLRFDEIAEPLRGVRIKLIIVDLSHVSVS